jgi:hypothetical protein
MLMNVHFRLCRDERSELAVVAHSNMHAKHAAAGFEFFEKI